MHFIEHGRDPHPGVAQAKPLDLAQDKIRFIPDLEKVRKIPEVLLGIFLSPAAFFDEAPDEQVPAGGEVDHAAMIVGDERDVRDAADRDRIRDLELTVTEIGAARAEDEREIIRDAEELAAVHAHTDEKLRLGIGLERAVEVLIFQKTADRGAPVFRRDARDLVDRNKTVHRDCEGPSIYKGTGRCRISGLKIRRCVPEFDKVYPSPDRLSIKTTAERDQSAPGGKETIGPPKIKKL